MIRASWPRADQTMIPACERREAIAESAGVGRSLPALHKLPGPLTGPPDGIGHDRFAAPCQAGEWWWAPVWVGMIASPCSRPFVPCRQRTGRASFFNPAEREGDLSAVKPPRSATPPELFLARALRALYGKLAPLQA